MRRPRHEPGVGGVVPDRDTSALISGPAEYWPVLPLPTLEIELSQVVDGLRLRPWRFGDAAALAAAWADPEIARWTGVPAQAEETNAASWIAGEQARRERGLAIDVVLTLPRGQLSQADADDGDVVVGEIGMSSFDRKHRAALVGYWLAPAHRGRGLASAALATVVTWAADRIGLRHVLAECHRDNIASIAVAERAGFTMVQTPESPRSGQQAVLVWEPS